MTQEIKKTNWKDQFKQDLNVYEFETTLPGNGKTVRFKPIVTKTLKKLLVFENTRDQKTAEQALDVIIENSVLDEGFDVEDLFLQDRFALLLAIRMKSKGESYQFEYKCPKCESQSIQSVNLNNFKIKELEKEYDKELSLTENIIIGIDFIKRKEQKEAMEYIDKNIKDDNEKQMDLALCSLALAIKYVKAGDERDDELSLDDRMYLIDNLPGQVLDKIKNWFADHAFGPDMNFTRKCPHCKNIEKTLIPMENFFVG